MPHAVDARTTAGGGTRSGASASTTTCASGRKTISQTVSWRSLAFRERASLDKRSFSDRLAGAEQLACLVHLVPHVPEEEAARAAGLVDVGDRPLAVRLLPGLDRGKPRVDLADGLVAEVEEIGVEKRQMV